MEEESLFDSKYQISRLSLKEYDIFLNAFARSHTLDELNGLAKKKIKGVPVWGKYLSKIGGICPIHALSLISLFNKEPELFPDKPSVKHYAGMAPTSSIGGCNERLKSLLFIIADVVMKEDSYWKQRYTEKYLYYKSEHSDWDGDKLIAFTRKYIATKFIIAYWKKLKELKEV